MPQLNEYSWMLMTFKTGSFFLFMGVLMTFLRMPSISVKFRLVKGVFSVL